LKGPKTLTEEEMDVLAKVLKWANEFPSKLNAENFLFESNLEKYMGHPRGKGIPLPKSMQLGASSKGKREVAGSLLSQGERFFEEFFEEVGCVSRGGGECERRLDDW